MAVIARHISPRRVTVFGIEAAMVVMCLLLASLLHGRLDALDGALVPLGLVTACCMLFLYWNELYDLSVVDTSAELVIRLMRSAGATAMAVAAASAVLPSVLIADGLVLTALLLLVCIVPVWRLAAQLVVNGHRLDERVLVIGTGATARIVGDLIERQRDFPYQLVGFTAEHPDPDAGDGGLRVLGLHQRLDEIIARERIERIVVSLSDRRGTLPLKQLLEAKLAGVHVEEATTLYERIAGKLLLDDLTPSWLIFSDGFRVSRFTRLQKRLLDVSCSAVGLVLTSPLLLLTAVAIRWDSPGPVLYRQERAGLRGRPFMLFKFRSMRTDAESGTPVWARDNDDRVTRIGRILRASRIDELPQLWNVLRGDMSLVGPRPERPFFVERLAAHIPFYRERHAVRPGVTGWAQVRYRYGSSVEDAIEKLRYDLYYIKHQSLAFDIAIALDTVKVMLVGKGAK